MAFKMTICNVTKCNVVGLHTYIDRVVFVFETSGGDSKIRGGGSRRSFSIRGGVVGGVFQFEGGG